MDKAEKILVSGDVKGKFAQLFKRITTINQKNGPFSLLLCVGEFFGEDDTEWRNVQTGKLTVPIPTFILGPCSAGAVSKYPDLKGGELAENLIYLGPHGVYPCSSGLRVAYLSGRDSLSATNNEKRCGFTFDDVKKLEISAGSNPRIDILITCDMPKHIFQFTKAPDGVDADKLGSLLVSRLTRKLRPRYHFVGSAGVFYERLPYRNHAVLQETSVNVTRFIALADVGNPEKQKWLYAFNAVPFVKLSHTELVKQPMDVTEHPFPRDVVEQAERLYTDGSDGHKGGQFFYDMSSKAQNEDGKGRHQKRKKSRDGFDSTRTPKKAQPQGPCWFCLASPDVEKHLVVSVGTYTYLALAKGGLVPDHLLILPIEHFQSSSNLDQETKEEIEKFKSSLRSAFASKGKSMVFFERNYMTQHLQVQCIPVPSKLDPFLMSTIRETCESRNIKLTEVPQYSDIGQLAPVGTPFFFMELPGGERLFHRISKSFPLQLGRELLACPPLLNIPERVNWRDCKSTVEEETEQRDLARDAFKQFDFTLQDDDDDSDLSDE